MSTAPHPHWDDREQRSRALDPSRSFAVQAPAGSGKTELLIQRYLGLLSTVERPESIVAITFTRKAAGEMLGRVLDALRGAAAGAPVEKPHERITRELALAALHHDRELGWDLLNQPGRLRIQTIDSLCASIAGSMPWLARLGAMPRIEDDTHVLYEEAARRTVRTIGHPEFGAPIEAILAHLDNDAARLSLLIAKMLETRDQWLAMTAPPGDEERTVIESAMRRAIARGIGAADALIPQEVRPAWLGLARAGGNCTGMAWPDHEAREEWAGLAETVLTSGNAWRRKPAGKGSSSADKSRLQNLVSCLEPIDGLLDAVKALRRLPPPGFTEDQWRIMRALLATLRVAAGRLHEVFREEGVMDFAEIGIAARYALGNLDQPTDLAFRLDARIEHLLVDEFQDTSRGQVELLQKLTAGWQPEDGRTLFVVGDPMQSIYRFRQAEVGLFLEAKERGIGGLPLEPLTLRTNHRTAEPLLRWLNRVFADIFPGIEDAETGAIQYTDCSAPRDEPDGQASMADGGPQWTFDAFFEGEEDREAERVVELARQARYSDPKETVAILVRARPHLTAIVKALRAAELHYHAVDIDPLSERPVVRDLLALTRAMLHVGDRISWLAVLRAPWCGLELRDLEALLRGRDRQTVWACLDDVRGLSEQGRVRAERARAVLGGALAERGRWPLRRWIERAWIALGGPACLESDEAALQDARDYLDLLEAEQAGADLGDFDHFRFRVEELFAKPDPGPEPWLHVMTIHKAKGLEFGTVIVPGLGRVEKTDDSRLFLFHEWEEDGGVQRLLAPIKESGTEKDPLYGYLNDLESRKNKLERVRQLYVAATRAKKRLHLLGQVKVRRTGEAYPDGRSMLADLWPALTEEERDQGVARGPGGASPKEHLGDDATRVAGVPLRRLPSGWEMPQLPDSVNWEGSSHKPAEIPHEPSFEWVSDSLRHAGSVVHAIVRRAEIDGPIPSLAVIRNALLREGVVPAELDYAAQRVRMALETVRGSQKARWILTGHREARSEYAVTGVVDGEIVRGTIDRTFVDEDGVRWIVDFKTSAHEGGELERFLDEQQRRYRDQMERYARLLEGLGGPVRLGLYFPLIDGWREWEWTG